MSSACMKYLMEWKLSKGSIKYLYLCHAQAKHLCKFLCTRFKHFFFLFFLSFFFLCLSSQLPSQLCYSHIASHVLDISSYGRYYVGIRQCLNNHNLHLLIGSYRFDECRMMHLQVLWAWIIYLECAFSILFFKKKRVIII